MVHETKLWCITSDKILIVDTAKKECPVLRKLLIYENEMSIIYDYALKLSENEIWISSKAKGGLYIWDTVRLKYEKINFDENIQICSMVAAQGSIWIGNKDGKVFIMSPSTRAIERELHAHTDLIKSMCETREGHVITGSASKEGKVCVWNSLMGFEVIDGKKRLVPKTSFDKIRSTYDFVDQKVVLSELIKETHFR